MAMAEEEEEVEMAMAAAAPVPRFGICALFYSCIKAFLFLSVAMLGFEVVANFKGWHLGAPELQRLLAYGGALGVQGAFDCVYSSWVMVRSEYLAPPLQLLANICVVLFLIQSADHLFLCLGCFWIRMKRIMPVPKSEASAGGEGGNIEAGALGLTKGYFPKVLVQIPMCNEREQSIAVVSNLDWPRSIILIQVLDDSDDAVMRAMIREEVGRWHHNGVNIMYRHRELRQGYKAGNLKSAMSCNYVRDYEFVAIFDAD